MGSLLQDRPGTGRRGGTAAHPERRRRRLIPRFNAVGGLGSTIWLIIVGVPLYVLITATFKRQAEYLDKGPLAWPKDLVFENYRTVLNSDFWRYFVNTAVVTVASAAIVVALAVPVGYVVVRSRTAFSSGVFRAFLLGLAIPAQAVIIPVYMIITKLELYDTLLAVILPTAAFCLPVSVLILAGTMRDIDEEQYEAMALDGASPARMLFQLVVPLSQAGISTVAVYSALQAWNGFLFPLILTQSADQRVLTLGLYDFTSQFGVNVPPLLAAVVLSMLPIFIVYLFARRMLINGLMGVGGK